MQFDETMHWFASMAKINIFLKKFRMQWFSEWASGVMKVFFKKNADCSLWGIIVKPSKYTYLKLHFFFNFRAQKARLPPTFIKKKKKIDEISLIINHGFHIFVKANVRRLLNLMNDFVEFIRKVKMAGGNKIVWNFHGKKVKLVFQIS